jgi:hypothetical protein
MCARCKKLRVPNILESIFTLDELFHQLNSIFLIIFQDFNSHVSRLIDANKNEPFRPSFSAVEATESANSSLSQSLPRPILLTPQSFENNNNNNVNSKRTTKSILKSPSTFSEKSIQFDDRVDIIPIEKRGEEEDQEGEEEGTQQIVETNKNEENPFNFFQPLKKASFIMNEQLIASPSVAAYLSNNNNNNNNKPKRANSIKAYNFYSSTSNLNTDNNNGIKQPVTRNEIESIKKMLLEPKAANSFNIIEQRSVSPLDPYSNSNRRLRNNTNRVFIKSPTPIREILNTPSHKSLDYGTLSGNYLTVPGSSNHNQVEIVDDDEQNTGNNINNANNHRLRFQKKKSSSSLRSQSVDLSKLMENFEDQQTTHNNNNFNQAQNKLIALMPPIPPPQSPSSRPNLTRQNAFHKSSSLTRSLGEDLDKINDARNHFEHRREEGENIMNSKHHHKHSKKRHHQNYNNKKLKYKTRSHSTTSHYHHNHQRYTSDRHYNDGGRASSLTSSSSSSFTESSFTTESETSNLTLSSNNSYKKRDIRNLNKNKIVNRNEILGQSILNLKSSGRGRAQAGCGGGAKRNRSFYYSSDDSICGIPKPNINKNKPASTKYVIFFYLFHDFSSCFFFWNL